MTQNEDLYRGTVLGLKSVGFLQYVFLKHVQPRFFFREDVEFDKLFVGWDEKNQLECN